MNRVLAAARMQLMHPALTFGIPWAIAASSFAVNLAIWGMGDVADQTPGDGSTGGLASLYITVLVIFIQAVTQIFPLALGLSLSRRQFYLGTALTAGIQAAGYGLALTLLTAVENATDGWGVRLHFWAPGVLDVGNPALQFLVFAVPMLACAFVGTGIGVVFKRWGAPGLYALSLVTILGGGLLAVWATWQSAWGDLLTWLGDRSVPTLTLGFPAALTVALAAVTFLSLRRTVP
jgi:hypothetical protein